jgi:hypothetical protein
MLSLRADDPKEAFADRPGVGAALISSATYILEATCTMAATRRGPTVKDGTGFSACGGKTGAKRGQNGTDAFSKCVREIRWEASLVS